ncbi:MAG TPA: hypothetical protein VHH33_08600, partial [Nitrososphaeraceae archaeon]|nr:hypothetical protein [Nitrososphaeraceae archaeon]
GFHDSKIKLAAIIIENQPLEGWHLLRNSGSLSTFLILFSELRLWIKGVRSTTFVRCSTRRSCCGMARS